MYIYNNITVVMQLQCRHSSRGCPAEDRDDEGANKHKTDTCVCVGTLLQRLTIRHR